MRLRPPAGLHFHCTSLKLRAVTKKRDGAPLRGGELVGFAVFAFGGVVEDGEVGGVAGLGDVVAFEGGEDGAEKGCFQTHDGVKKGWVLRSEDFFGKFVWKCGVRTC